jgi:hypothetical protein
MSVEGIVMTLETPKVQISARALADFLFEKGHPHEPVYLEIKEPIIDTDGLPDDSVRQKVKAATKNLTPQEGFGFDDYERLFLSGKSYIRIYKGAEEELSGETLYTFELNNIAVEGNLQLDPARISGLIFKNSTFENLEYKPKYRDTEFTLGLYTAEGKNISLSGYVAVRIEDSDIAELSVKDADILQGINIESSSISERLEIDSIDCRLLEKHPTPGLADLHPRESQPQILIKDCQAFKEASISIDNVRLNRESVLRIENLRGSRDVYIGMGFFFEQGAFIDIIRCDLSIFRIDTEDLTFVKLLDNTLAVSEPSRFDPLLKIRTYRVDGLDFPDWVDQTDAKRYIHNEKNKYIDLRKEAKERGDKHLEDELYYCQMFWELKENKDPFNWLYQKTCGYGLSVFKPILLYISTFLIFAYIFHWVTSLDNLSLSLSGSIPLFDYLSKLPSEKQQNIPFWIYLLFYIERVLQLLFLFEAGSAIRNRVKK